MTQERVAAALGVAKWLASSELPDDYTCSIRYGTIRALVAYIKALEADRKKAVDALGVVVNTPVEMQEQVCLLPQKVMVKAAAKWARLEMRNEHD